MIYFLTGLAFATGENADIELIRSNLAPRSIPGIESPFIGAFGTFHFSAHTQYTRDPLVFYSNNLDQGAVVARRQNLDLNVGFDFSPRVGIQLQLPSSYQWGTERPSESRTGFGLRDTNTTLRVAILRKKNLGLALKTTVFLPTASQSAWLGESTTRSTIASNILYETGAVDWLTEIGVHLRQPVNTGQDFVLGNELLGNLGVRWNIWPKQFAIGSSLVSRSGTVHLWKGGAENAVELVNFAQWKHDKQFDWQFGISKGLNSGYGTSEFRALLQLSYHKKPKKQPPKPEITDLPEDPVVVKKPKKPKFKKQELAKKTADQIIIRDAIQFELGTAKILLGSLPTLRFVAKLINEDIQIGHLVIEGHASEEGSYSYNYDLSNLRARAIYRALVNAGVHPDRLSHRGFGEAMPKTTGTDEANLSKNRRVEFHIVRQDPPTQMKKKIRKINKKPWDGKVLEPVTPIPNSKRIDDGNEELKDILKPNKEEKDKKPNPEGEK